MNGRATTIIAVTALAVACLAATPVGQAAGKFVLGKNAVGTLQLKKNAVTGAKVKNGSLLAADFRQGQLPAGPQGPKGDTGAKGPRGDAGAQGIQGLPGTARAYGRIDRAGNVTRSKNVASVTHVGTGLYCITLAPAIDPSTTGLVAGTDYTGDDTRGGDNQPQAFVEYVSGTGLCPIGKLGVATFERVVQTSGGLVTAVTNQGADEPFFFVVP